jgi:hypothetical protein
VLDEVLRVDPVGKGPQLVDRLLGIAPELVENSVRAGGVRRGELAGEPGLFPRPRNSSTRTPSTPTLPKRSMLQAGGR